MTRNAESVYLNVPLGTFKRKTPKYTCSKCDKKLDSLACRYCNKCKAAYMREWRKTHPLNEEQRFKSLVRNKTKMRVKRGLLVKKPCEICNEQKVEAHHDDYNKPYDVRWLCRSHHLEFHQLNGYN